MIDRYGRNINKLRLSVIDACNLSCIYCVGEVGGHQISQNRLSLDEMVGLVALLKKHAGIEKVRITGGEPLLFPALPQLIESIVKLGVNDVRLTTNAQQLRKKAFILKKSGLQGINVSLDSLQPQTFSRLARGGKLEKTLDGIETALQIGIPVKINTVVMKGENDQEVNDILEYGLSHGVEVRFLEVMKMGPLYEQGNPKFVAMEEMLAQIGQRHSYYEISSATDSTAVRFRVKGGTFGIIANESAPFCASCSRLRLTSTGKLVGCLSNPQEIPLRHLLQSDQPEQEIKKLVAQSIAQKRTSAFTGSLLGMSAVGG